MKRQQRRSSVGGKNLPSIQNDKDDGSANLEAMLTAKKYVRIPRSAICGDGAVAIEDPMQLTVFMHNGGKWATLSGEEVAKMWNVASLTQRSFCTILSRNIFKLTSRQHKTLDRALDDSGTPDVIGVYKNADDNYALVVRVPVHYRNEKLAVSLAGGVLGAGMTAASLTGLNKHVEGLQRMQRYE
jgi:hypothetical protein